MHKSCRLKWHAVCSVFALRMVAKQSRQDEGSKIGCLRRHRRLHKKKVKAQQYDEHDANRFEYSETGKHVRSSVWFGMV